MEKDSSQLATKGPSELSHKHATRNGGYFEYKVIKVSDLLDGGANVSKIEEMLNLYGEMGWRLSQTIVNEIGSAPFVSEETAHIRTQEETLLILERWVPVS